MADMTKEELRRGMEGLGERPNPRHTKVELRHRISELTGEDMGRNVKGQNKTLSPCQQLIKELNKASNKKKADVVSFCLDTLKMSEKEVNHKTVAQLQMAAMKNIMINTSVHFLDQVNFGKHSECLYHEILEKFPEYGVWIKKTYREGGSSCDPLLRRLACWLEDQDKEELKTEATPKKALFRGYATSKKMAHDTPSASNSASSSSSETKVFKEMIGAIRELQKEVQELKQEPARKKAVKSEESDVETDGSFMKVSTRP